MDKKRAEEWFGKLIREGMGMVAVVDSEGTYTYVSPSYKIILGYEADELIGNNAFELMHPEDSEQIFEEFLFHKTSKKKKSSPYRFRKKDGSYIWLQSFGTNLLDDPDVEGIVVNSVDATESHYYNRLDSLERKVLEMNSARKDLESLLSVYIQGIEEIHPGMLCSILKVEGNQLFNVVSPNLPKTYVEAIEGLEIGKDQGACGTAAYLGEKVIISDAEIDERTSKFLGLVEEYQFKALWSIPVKDENQQVIATIAAYYHEAREPGGYEEKTIDRASQLLQVIFKSHRAVQALHESNMRFMYANKATEEVIYDHDMKGDEIMLSENFERIFGYTFADEEFTLEKWASYVHPDDRDEINRRLETVLEDRKTNKWEAEFRYARKDGTYAYVFENSFILRDKNGKPIRMIGSVRDITDRKNREVKQKLITEVSRAFNETEGVRESLKKALNEFNKFGNFELAEVWLTGYEEKTIELVAALDKEDKKFYDFDGGIVTFQYGEGLPGKTWKSEKVQFWKNLDKRKSFLRRKAAEKEGLQSVYGVPITNKNEVIGVLVLGMKENVEKTESYRSLLKEIAVHVGEEIKRKELEAELSRIFTSAPDGIVIAGFDGYFKKVNPAMCDMLGYTESELLSIPFFELLHPDDKEETLKQFEVIEEKELNHYYENRYITKSGEILWLAWSSRLFIEEGVAYSVVKNITEEKKLENLHEQATRLAKIGSWEVDLVNEKLYWSDITREIHEVEPGFEPDLDRAINFYKEGDSREKASEALNRIIEEEEPFDLEVQIVTAKGNERWIRAIGEAEMVEGKCVRLYGSFQDIHDSKSVEQRLENITNNLPGVVFQYISYPDDKDNMLYVSDAAKEVWGYSKDEASENVEQIWGRVHPDDLEAMWASGEKSAKTLNQWHHVWRYLHPDGSTRWLEGFGTFQSESENSTIIDAIIIDITEKKKLEELVEQATHLAKIGSWELDLQKSDNEMYWSYMTREILEVDKGYNPTLTGGFEFYTSESKELIQQAVDKAINEGEPFDLELLITTAKGNEKWIRCIGQSEIVDGESIRLYGSYQDIHLRKVAELELEERNRHINAIASLNAALLNYTEWFEALKNHFDMIGEAVQADRVYYFENRFDPETGEGFTTQKLEWCREGIISQLGNPDLDEMPFKELGQLIKPMINGYSSMAALSEVAEDTLVRDVMESQDIQTFLTIPVNVHGKFHGFIGFDNCTDEAKWSDQEVRTLKTITSNLAVAIERSQTENERKELLEEKNQILESISDAFYALDENWQITYFNSEAENLLGKEWENIVGNSLWKVFPAAKETELYKIYHEVKEKKKPQSFEYFYPPLNSWYDISAYPAEKGISVYFKNIDDRKESQQKILKKTRQLDAISRFNSLLIKEDDWLKALDECLKMFGLVADTDRVYYFEHHEEEDTGQSLISMRAEWVRDGIKSELDNPVHHDLLLTDVSPITNVLTEGKTFNRVVKEIKDSEFRKFLQEQEIKSILAIPVFTGDTFRGFIGFDDCTKERTWRDEEIMFLETISFNLASALENEDAEIALQEAYEEKNSILESIGDGFFAVDYDFTVTYWNNKAEELLFTPKEKVIDKNLWEVFDKEQAKESYRQYGKALKERKALKFEDYYEPIDRWFDVNVYPSVNGISVFFKDITDRKIADEKLKELNRSLEEQAKELAASNAELEQFAFVASHDLQEPLRMITGFLDLLEKKYDSVLDEKGRKYIHFATDGAKRMREIILDLLEFSRIGRVDTEREEVDMNQLVDEVISLNKKIVTENDAKIEADGLPIITAAKGSMRQLLQNLVNNALKYQPKKNKPNVKILCREDESRWHFTVEDNGIGIHSDYSEKIFNIFQRLHGRDEYSGSGMGLAICKKIVEEHDGEIWVESEEEKGSAFHFTIAKKQGEVEEL